jgi:hypothetical protein
VASDSVIGAFGAFVILVVTFGCAVASPVAMGALLAAEIGSLRSAAFGLDVGKACG